MIWCFRKKIFSQTGQMQQRGMTVWIFTFKPQFWQKKLQKKLHWTRPKCYQSSQDWRLITKQSSQEGGGGTRLDKSTITDERRRTVDTDLWATRDRRGSFWFILSRIPPGLLATRTEELEPLQQREKRQMDSTNPCCPETVFPGSSCEEARGSWALYCVGNGLNLKYIMPLSWEHCPLSHHSSHTNAHTSVSVKGLWHLSSCF